MDKSNTLLFDNIYDKTNLFDTSNIKSDFISFLKKHYHMINLNEFTLKEHQKIIKEYMIQLDTRGILLFHGLGSGKSCTSITTIESILQNILDELSNINSDIEIDLNSIYKHMYVFTPASLRDNYKNELSFCGKKIKEYKNDNKLSDDFIKYINYNSKDYEKKLIPSDSNETNSLDNSIIIIDEIHNLALQISNSILGNTNNINTDSIFKLYNLICNSKNSKLIFLSGTPIINYPYELLIIINLLYGCHSYVNILINSELNLLNDIETKNIFEINEFDYNKYVENIIKKIKELDTDNTIIKNTKSIEIVNNNNTLELRLYKTSDYFINNNIDLNSTLKKNNISYEINNESINNQNTILYRHEYKLHKKISNTKIDYEQYFNLIKNIIKNSKVTLEKKSDTLFNDSTKHINDLRDKFTKIESDNTYDNKLDSTIRSIINPDVFNTYKHINIGNMISYYGDSKQNMPSFDTSILELNELELDENIIIESNYDNSIQVEKLLISNKSQQSIIYEQMLEQEKGTKSNSTYNIFKNDKRSQDNLYKIFTRLASNFVYPVYSINNIKQNDPYQLNKSFSKKGGSNKPIQPTPPISSKSTGFSRKSKLQLLSELNKSKKNTRRQKNIANSKSNNTSSKKNVTRRITQKSIQQQKNPEQDTPEQDTLNKNIQSEQGEPNQNTQSEQGEPNQNTQSEQGEPNQNTDTPEQDTPEQDTPNQDIQSEQGEPNQNIQLEQEKSNQNPENQDQTQIQNLETPEQDTPNQDIQSEQGEPNQNPEPITPKKSIQQSEKKVPNLSTKNTNNKNNKIIIDKEISDCIVNRNNTSDKYKNSDEYNKHEFYSNELQLDNLYNYSCKYYTLLKLLQKDSSKIHLVYSFFVNNEGLNMIRNILLINNYNEFNPYNSTFIKKCLDLYITYSKDVTNDKSIDIDTYINGIDFLKNKMFVSLYNEQDDNISQILDNTNEKQLKNISQKNKLINLIKNENVDNYTQKIGSSSFVEEMIKLFQNIKTDNNSLNDEYKNILNTEIKSKDSTISIKVTTFFNIFFKKMQNNINTVLISKKSAEGISFKNINYVHIIEPFWNFSIIKQIIGRARRINSHENFINDNDKKVHVYLYLYNHTNNITNNDKNNIPLSTDIIIYNNGNRKNKINIFYLEKLISSSFDCNFNKESYNDNIQCIQQNTRTIKQSSNEPNIEDNQTNIEDNQTNIEDNQTNIEDNQINEQFNENIPNINDISSKLNNKTDKNEE